MIWAGRLAAAVGVLVACQSPATARVASLNLCTDELLLHLASPSRIASVSHLSHSPNEASYWRHARRHPANDGSVLGVARHRPKIILTMGGAGRDGERLARAIGARMVVLPFPNRLADVAAGVRQVAGLVGNPAGGERLVRAMGELAQTVPALRPGLYLSGAGDVLAPGGVSAEWLRLAGFTAPVGTPARVTLEHLLLRPPPLIIRSDYRTAQVSANTRWQRHPAWARLRAVPTIATDGRRWTCAGPSLMPEILRLRRARP